MSVRYLLDTNIISSLSKEPHGKVAVRIAAEGDKTVGTSIIVAAEIRFGAAKKNSRQLTDRLEGILARLEILPLGAPADVVYGELRSRLERMGTPIGPNDLLIAAHALATDCTLVTDNIREFSRIEELPLENWLV